MKKILILAMLLLSYPALAQPFIVDAETGEYLSNMGVDVMNPNSTNDPMEQYNNPTPPDPISNPMDNYDTPMLPGNTENPYGSDSDYSPSSKGYYR
ncbi:hypothetical protein W03_20600 [Nitrosomonas sp. PY1]|uniref:hypothetical protein n=1 Tax=Nitrosomonas sp. PY1 TaxID=1803906 RepID=UPI001FC8A0E8|nr:hypothetical protein [Nitrosomonas sp. PY1]GKS70056.1 hypothetical protein W03_20600 [Nitrosomonas sp. PY1]